MIFYIFFPNFNQNYRLWRMASENRADLSANIFKTDRNHAKYKLAKKKWMVVVARVL